MISFISKNDGKLLLSNAIDNRTILELEPKDCIKLYHYLAERHFPNHPNIFVDKSIGEAFH
jgi:hypothetical protein